MKQRITLAALGRMAALTLAVVGIGVASAQSGTTEADTTYDRFINRVAQIPGTQPAQVRSAMTQASTEQIDQAVKDGDLTQEQADEIKARIRGDRATIPGLRRETPRRQVRSPRGASPARSRRSAAPPLRWIRPTATRP